MKGRHDLRAGYLMNFFYLDHWQPETGNPRGSFTFNGAVTALNGGAQTNNFYNLFASFLLGDVGTPGKSVQNELMTAREWQHSLYVRDRWTPTTKLTLRPRPALRALPDHAPRGRARRRSPRPRPNLDVLIAGRGGNPQNNGMSMSWNNFAPRLGAIYRLNEKTVFRTGYGLTYNATPWARAVRGDNDYPITLAVSFPNVDSFGFYSTLEQGIPTIVAPDQSTGRVPLDRSAAEYTPEIDNIDRGYVQTWNVAFERRIMYDMSVDVAYVGAKGTGGYAALDINAPTVLGTGNQGRPYFSLGRIVRHQLVGRPAEDGLPVAAGLAEQAVHARPAAQGRLHAQQVEEPERQRRPRDAELEHAERAATATTRSPGSTGRTTSRWALRTRCRGRRRAATTTSFSAIVNDWQVNGLLAAFSGTPFTVTADGAQLEHAEQHARRPTSSARSTRPATSAPPASGSIPPRSRSRPASASATRAATSSAAPAAGTWTSPSFRSFPIGGHAAARVPAAGRQPVQPPGLRQPERRPHVRQLRPDHRRRESVSRTADPDGPAVLVLISTYTRVIRKGAATTPRPFLAARAASRLACSRLLAFCPTPRLLLAHAWPSRASRCSLAPRRAVARAWTAVPPLPRLALDVAIPRPPASRSRRSLQRATTSRRPIASLPRTERRAVASARLRACSTPGSNGTPRTRHTDGPRLWRRGRSTGTYLDAVVLQRLALPSDAAARLREALKISADYLPARVRLAEALLDAGDLDESARLFSDAERPGLRARGAVRPRQDRGGARAGTRKPSQQFRAGDRAVPGVRRRALRAGPLIQGDRPDVTRRRPSLAAPRRFGARWPALRDPVLETVDALREDPGALMQRGYEARRRRRSRRGHRRPRGGARSRPIARPGARKPDLALRPHEELGQGRRALPTRSSRLAAMTADAHYDYGVLLGMQEKWERCGGGVPPGDRAQSAARARAQQSRTDPRAPAPVRCGGGGIPAGRRQPADASHRAIQPRTHARCAVDVRRCHRGAAEADRAARRGNAALSVCAGGGARSGRPSRRGAEVGRGSAPAGA